MRARFVNEAVLNPEEKYKDIFINAFMSIKSSDRDKLGKLNKALSPYNMAVKDYRDYIGIKEGDIMYDSTDNPWKVIHSVKEPDEKIKKYIDKEELEAAEKEQALGKNNSVYYFIVKSRDGKSSGGWLNVGKAVWVMDYGVVKGVYKDTEELAVVEVEVEKFLKNFDKPQEEREKIAKFFWQIMGHEVVHLKQWEKYKRKGVGNPADRGEAEDEGKYFYSEVELMAQAYSVVKELMDKLGSYEKVIEKIKDTSKWGEDYMDQFYDYKLKRYMELANDNPKYQKLFKKFKKYLYLYAQKLK